MNFLTFIIKNLLRRKARSVLTACGIALAVATLITLLGVADDFQNAILQSFQNEGSDIVISPKGELLQVAGDLPESHGPATAAVPGVGLVMLTLVLNQVGLPVEGIALIIGVDRLLDMMRTACNVTGDCAVTCIIASSENALDIDVFNDPDAGQVDSEKVPDPA